MGRSTPFRLAQRLCYASGSGAASGSVRLARRMQRDRIMTTTAQLRCLVQPVKEPDVSDKIPANPAWCSYCIQSEEGPCESHRGRNGRPKAYSGHDGYEPSEWVLRVVGQRYTAWDAHCHCIRTWECFGYDPRHGFWMRTVDDFGVYRETNVSERAIDRTWLRSLAQGVHPGEAP